jgi:hypothetical protein
MNFTFVNKNLLIPQVETYSDFDSPIQKLLNMGYNMSNLYCSNLYVVSTNCIYFLKNNYLYSVSETNIIKKIDINIPNNSFLKSINSFLNLTTCNQNLDNGNNENNGNNGNNGNNFNDLDSQMNINFNIREHTNIIIKDEVIINNNKSNQELEPNTNNIVKPIVKEDKIERVKTQEELELIKLCEETMEIYQTEVRKIKDIEQKIKILDNNKKTLLKKRKEKLFTNFSKLKNDYDTFKMINKKLERNPKLDIPSLFILKYNYFVQFVLVDNNIKILAKIEDSNLDEVLNNDYELDEEIEKIVNKYNEDSKNLNVIFEHSWEDLDYETESTENNNSRLAGY